MYPALRESDILKIYADSEYFPSKGDIVLFEHPENKNNVIHRVIAIEGDRIFTKGDNTHKPDPWTLRRNEIKGIVTQIWRNKKTIHVYNYHQKSVQTYQRLQNLVWQLYLYLKPVYKISPLKGIFYKLLPDRIKPRPVIFTSGSTVKLCLFLNKIYIARYDNIRGKWFIKPPFKFMISQECMDNARIIFEKHLLPSQNPG